jgi:23S rRNA G2445 N2-methylase RlmL
MIYLSAVMRDYVASGKASTRALIGSEIDPRKSEAATRNLHNAGLAGIARISFR